MTQPNQDPLPPYSEDLGECPKCGDWFGHKQFIGAEVIRGYGHFIHLPERMEWRCRSCGFVKCTKPKDG